ncbi:hypothetical protein [Mycobacterium sp. OTB74]|jgi:hypothetical protein|uniref:hypothetical protein n=1 Tax=Mycobacterium sp. OTB74 TaxID=1853452 RepID=UPI002474C571|nr:hypothetical protein [Mycobacterium sp. OTB74]MDH6243824.1 hypothetical protein [Mycobacterium sp. OTB74]
MTQLAKAGLGENAGPLSGPSPFLIPPRRRAMSWTTEHSVNAQHRLEETMAIQQIPGFPVIISDDGEMFIFGLVDANKSPLANGDFFGFLHRPVSASAPFGSPPVTWSSTSDLATWVETVKYAFRNNLQIFVGYDDAVTDQYTANDGTMYTLTALYTVTPHL